MGSIYGAKHSGPRCSSARIALAQLTAHVDRPASGPLSLSSNSIRAVTRYASGTAPPGFSARAVNCKPWSDQCVAHPLRCLASPHRAVNCIREGSQFGVHDRGHSGHGLLRSRRKARGAASTGGYIVTVAPEHISQQFMRRVWSRTSKLRGCVRRPPPARIGRDGLLRGSIHRVPLIESIVPFTGHGASRSSSPTNRHLLPVCVQFLLKRTHSDDLLKGDPVR
jgi:hypothetical protein